MIQPLMVALVGSVMLSALPAAAAPSGHWGDRAAPRDPALHFIDQSIDHGRDVGVLNTQEITRLKRARHALMVLKRQALADGVLTAKEHREVRLMEQKLMDELRNSRPPQRQATRHQRTRYSGGSLKPASSQSAFNHKH